MKDIENIRCYFVLFPNPLSKSLISDLVTLRRKWEVIKNIMFL